MCIIQDGNSNAISSLEISSTIQALDVNVRRNAVQRVLNDAYVINGGGGAYTDGDIVSKDAAGVASPLHWDMQTGGGQVMVANVSTNYASITNAQFKLHLWGTLPTFTAADNAALSTKYPVYGSDYLGSMIVTLDQLGSDGASGVAYPTVGQSIVFDGGDLYGILEAKAAYTPSAGQAFKIRLSCI